MAKHITIQERRCARCGAVQLTPPPSGLCLMCEKRKSGQ